MVLPGWPLLLAAIPTAGSPRQYELAYARPTGPWLPFATLEITQTTYRGHDVDLSFDPVLNVVPGLETYDCGLLNYAGSPTPPLAERASTGTVNPRPSRNYFWSGTSPRSTLNTAAMLQQEPSTEHRWTTASTDVRHR